MGALYRNEIGLGVKSRTSASHDGSEAGNGKATDDTDYSNVPGGPTARTLRKKIAVLFVSISDSPWRGN